MRSRSLRMAWVGNKFLNVCPHAGALCRFRGGWVGVTLKAARTLNDTGTGSARKNTGANLRTHLPYGSVVEVTGHPGGRADPLAGLRHGPRVHGPLVLRARRPLPDAVLLAVRQRRV